MGKETVSKQENLPNLLFLKIKKYNTLIYNNNHPSPYKNYCKYFLGNYSVSTIGVPEQFF